MDTSKILVIDDDQFVLQSVSTLLKSWGYNVMEATNTLETLGQIKQNKISHILLDIKLGWEKGFEVLKLIKLLDSSITVIIMTAYPDEYNKNHFFAEGAKAFLIKPINPVELKETLESDAKTTQKDKEA